MSFADKRLNGSNLGYFAQQVVNTQYIVSNSPRNVACSEE